ncbi:hypothetical protein [Chondromyces crocatus]|uniref:Uncharacterized protein n=1 Tax=Chondromyces crocatus TaxID=52 RepID=A0A0K1ET01_CHOCO|nr:hypothetical protein [Chondromyces crocatus]AKT43748.1 uncharacterized protein CMC5_079840 [Chondromyces crocatus]
MACEIWLEFECWEASAERDFFNMHIKLPDGTSYALNVWTFAYAARALEDVRDEMGPPYYSKGPDLLVEVAERESLQKIAERLVAEGQLLPVWRVTNEPIEP